jgi:hypothetical protein
VWRKSFSVYEFLRFIFASVGGNKQQHHTTHRHQQNKRVVPIATTTKVTTELESGRAKLSAVQA